MTGLPTTLINAQVPRDADAPLVLNTSTNALQMAVVLREAVLQLDPADWNAAGIYFLIGGVAFGKPTEVYVGKSGSGTAGPRNRLSRHNKKPPQQKNKPPLQWWRAAIFRRNITDGGWNGSEIGYLEGRLRAELEGTAGITIVSEKNDTEESLSPAETGALDQIVPVILANLRLLGLPVSLEVAERALGSVSQPGGAEKKPKRRKTKAKSKRTFYPETISDLLASGELAAGDVFVYERQGSAAKATVSGSGELIVDGKGYSNPSAAAMAAHNVKAAPGWDVWKQEAKPHRSLADLRARHRRAVKNK